MDRNPPMDLQLVMIEIHWKSQLDLLLVIIEFQEKSPPGNWLVLIW